MTYVRNLLNNGLFNKNVQIIEKMKTGTYVYSSIGAIKIRSLMY